ncbi:MAG: 3-phosphoshikimate 1-carboxyvinyltransferase [Acidobacteria bacterium]|nr:MAG: 3-phosphoshikimate 1-carboxyvinyltransferase [Acidobacteriota bacterium]
MNHAERLEIAPAARIQGSVRVPGDKSISHRLAMIGAIAEGTTIIHNFAASQDCQSTLECLEQLRTPILHTGSTVLVEGRGLEGFEAPRRQLNAGNSGTRDDSLSRRPMKRIIDPLRRFGAIVEARDDNYLPLTIRGGPLSAISFTMPTASAQVKSAVLLAGLQAAGVSKVHEPVATRNHTEIALSEFGAHIHFDAGEIKIEGRKPLQGKEFAVPGDLSSAAFLIAAALCVPDSKLRLTGVGLNPTRSGFLSLLQQTGARILISQLAPTGGEPIGEITVETSELSGMDIGGSWIPNVIDEIPILAILGTRTRQGIRIHDAAELRKKESDRIRAVATNLQRLGAQVQEFPDGLLIPGNQTLRGGTVDSFGDHRIAMAFSVAGLIAVEPVTIQDPSCVRISFPGFFEWLDEVVYRD